MKSKLLIVLFILSKISFSQTKDDKVIFLDSLWNETTPKEFKYMRIIKDYNLEKADYILTDYYLSGNPQMVGKVEDKDKLSRTGQFVYYYENGNKQKIVHYNKNKLVGSSFELYENGNKKLEGEYIEEKDEANIYKIKNYWDKNNNQKVLDGNGTYEEIGKKFFASGEIKEGVKEGVWQGFDKERGSTFSEIYKDKMLISGVSIDSDKISHDYKVVEKRPEPKKGIMSFYRFVSKNFKYPDNMPKDKIGKIIIRFVVDKDGKIIEPKIIKSIGYGADEEAVRMLLSFQENWTPGEIRGIRTRCTFALPIEIQARF